MYNICTLDMYNLYYIYLLSYTYIYIYYIHGSLTTSYLCIHGFPFVCFNAPNCWKGTELPVPREFLAAIILLRISLNLSACKNVRISITF